MVSDEIKSKTMSDVYKRQIYDIQDSFFEKNYDTENFDEIQVPSVWQIAGYDTHPVSYTHLDVYKRQVIRFCPRAKSDGRINNTKMHGESITQNNRRKEHERS